MDKVARKKNMKKRRIIFSIITILLCLGITATIYLFNTLDKVKTVELPKTNEELGIDNEIDNLVLEKGVKNIALFGVDSREETDTTGSRSDSIMILTLDYDKNKIKLTSIMRDTYVKVAGHGMTKITHAYAYGGANLAVRTINENFGLDIRDYATVDFSALVKVIDAVGGVEINVKENEIKKGRVDVPLINDCIREISMIEKVPPIYVTTPGIQTLNGIQAVAYSRIRYAGNGDFERTERQRNVLQQVIEKATKSGVTKYPKILNAVLPYVTTSLTKASILNMGASVITSGITIIEQFRMPEDGIGHDKMINGVYYLVADLNIEKKNIYKFIYEEEKVTKDTKNTKDAKDAKKATP